MKIVRVLLESSQESLNRRGPDFVTIRTRPKRGEIGPYKLLDPVLPVTGGPIGVVIQGPLLLADDFTVETVRYYSRHCPELRVIVSTWEGEDAAALARIRDLGAEILLNQKPQCPGRLNVNFQVVSTRAGISNAVERGCGHVAKTRSDQRIYALPMLLSLPRLLEQFPVRNTDRQQKRLISTSRITSKYAPYFLSDLFMFGTAEDMLDYWSPRPDEVEKSRTAIMAEVSGAWNRQATIALTPEHYLVREYLAKDSAETPFTLPDWWTVLSDRLCIIDWTSLDVYWPKYDPNDDRADLHHDRYVGANPVRFADWLSLYFTSANKWTGAPDSLLALPSEAELPLRLAAI